MCVCVIECYQVQRVGRRGDTKDVLYGYEAWSVI
jgi:hypothetical protein